MSDVIDFEAVFAAYAAAFDRFCENGRVFIGAKLPKGYRRRRAKECFANAQALAVQKRGTYVEGVCVTPKTPIPIHHGWITLDGVHAIDPTFADSEHCLYFGITFDTVELAKAIAKEGAYHCQLDLGALTDLPPQLREMVAAAEGRPSPPSPSQAAAIRAPCAIFRGLPTSCTTQPRLPFSAFPRSRCR
jgi:hypothetical protein